MTITQETLADIVAEMRRRIAVKMSDAWYTQDEWRDLCDRIEAAAKRDYEYPKAQSLDADKLTGKSISGLVTDLRQIAKYHYARGNIEQGQFARVMADRIKEAYRREMSKIVSKNGADFGQLGDAAAMRKALEFIKLASDDYGKYGNTKAGALDVIYEKACAALSAPPRNCDMGTAKEQTARIRKLCTKFKPSCIGCPCYGDIHRVNCWLTWAQMPYEEGGAV